MKKLKTWQIVLLVIFYPVGICVWIYRAIKRSQLKKAREAEQAALSARREAGIFDETYPISQLDRLLSDAELLVMALPNTPETVNILNRERIARLPKEAIVINVGRGSALDQAALAEALNTDRIAGAALDVVDPEPLPENDPLWDTKHLILTPHISGNLTLGYTCDRNVELFCEDLANYAAGRPLSHLVDRKRGY